MTPRNQSPGHCSPLRIPASEPPDIRSQRALTGNAALTPTLWPIWIKLSIFRGFPNHATAKTAAIDGRLEADFDIIWDNNPAKLTNLLVPLGAE